jgi:hypothetical protein
LEVLLAVVVFVLEQRQAGWPVLVDFVAVVL